MVPVFIPYLALVLLLFRRFLLSITTFVFAAFISPSSLTLGDGLRLAKADWSRLVSAFADYRILTVVIVLVILALLWAYNRSLAEGLSIVASAVVAVALLIAIPIAGLPTPLRLASTTERGLVARASSGAYGYSGRDILLFLAVLAIAFAVLWQPWEFGWMLGRLSWLLIGTVALVATIALFPYVHYIYPVPQKRDYYAEVTHAMWLPAERIVLNTHHIYYGYILSSGGGWFSVLLANSRTIAYIPANEVIGRTVCQPRMRAQPKQYPPLVPWLYNAPPQLPLCARRDGVTSITSFLSRGQSLRTISSIIQVSPEGLISMTNARQHERLSVPLQTYERVHNWDAPTPVGQRFWYYPRPGPIRLNRQPP
jgi:hypothetical protein